MDHRWQSILSCSLVVLLCGASGCLKGETAKRDAAGGANVATDAVPGSGGIAGGGASGNFGSGGAGKNGDAGGLQGSVVLSGGNPGTGIGAGTGGDTGPDGGSSLVGGTASGGVGLGGATGSGDGTVGTGGRVAGNGAGGGVGSGGTPGSGGATQKTDAAIDAPADAGGTTSRKLPADSLAVRFADSVIKRWPDPASIVAGSGWEYSHGIVLRGMEQVYRYTNDSRYLSYIKTYVDQNVTDAGGVDIPSTYSLDNIQPSVLLPFLYQQTKAAKYQTAAASVRARYDSFPRNADKGFWHKQQYPNQMWLDSIYMGEPFLARYGAVFDTCGTFCADTVVEQILLIAQHVRDAKTGLLYHAWDDSAAGQKVSWADPTTGRSPCIWGRALGWYAMSLVDILGDLSANQNGRSEMLTILTGLAAGLKNTQDSTTGLWYQVVDQGSKSDNWLETSASGMFVYALKVGVDRGYLDSSYLVVAEKGWQGLKTKVSTDSNGLPSINGAVQGMGVQTDYAGYLNQTKLSNSPHGLCAILLAASEMEAKEAP